jgi:hypothetical protein
MTSQRSYFQQIYCWTPEIGKSSIHEIGGFRSRKEWMSSPLELAMYVDIIEVEELYSLYGQQSYIDIFRAICQNRSRIRRTLCHTLRDWESLQMDVSRGYPIRKPFEVELKDLLRLRN